MICNNILEAMGNTPIIRLSKMAEPDSAEILVKFEGLNVGGSIKTRVAYNMVMDAVRQGKITKDTIIVEPTSGNQGIGLALVGAVRGYKTKIIIAHRISSVKNADLILVLNHGNLIEWGTHDKLIAQNGYYKGVFDHQFGDFNQAPSYHINHPANIKSFENGGDKNGSK